MEYYSAVKKNEIMPFATTWMDLEIIMLVELNQRKANIIQYHFYVGSEKNDINELIYKTSRLKDIENKLMVAKGKSVWGRDKLGVWD